MNLRMIRVWGGALLERPAFYDACDEYGILVFQDLWGSGDCNGAWQDPMKLDSRERRREYPDNHSLFLRSVEDQVQMIRNHPSLCLWCGANEWPLAKDIDSTLSHEVFPKLGPNRLFIHYSTDTLFSFSPKEGPADGPYGIQEPEWFFTHRSIPFNPESGSVGIPEVESMRAIFTPEELKFLPHGRRVQEAWTYHKYLPYGNFIERYGKPADIEDFCKYAQAVNYNQYRSFMEGRAAKMWDWYNGILIWKTQNPWTALRGQMYDWFLDVNACLYGTMKGCAPLHPFYNLADKRVEVLNSALENHALKVTARLFRADGTVAWTQSAELNMPGNQVKELFPVPSPEGVEGIYFLKLSLEEKGKPISNNIYWLSTKTDDYTGLNSLPRTVPQLQASLQKVGDFYKGTVSLEAGPQISFFNRIKVFDRKTGKRILPVHYSDNYITLMPHDKETVHLDFPADRPLSEVQIVVDSWTADRQEIPLR
jgi:hypothetical protein